ncbi:hypothetical protein O0L34_g3766 [Tuta absoluta]|nr:hypothetical protein O0L34_g3766 [Tuta absoluta]
MAAVGLAEPELADPNEEIPDGPPKELMSLGPLRVSEDYVIGKEECLRLFPPGYNEPEHKPKKAVKKKKKKRAKEEAVEDSTDVPPSESLDTTEAGTEPEEGEGEENGEDIGEEGEELEEGDEQAVADKATSPPPLTPH